MPGRLAWKVSNPMPTNRVIHIVPAISEEASGPSYSVVRLCESLITLDWTPMPSPPVFLKAFIRVSMVS